MSKLRRIVFYRQESGREPVREWLLNLARCDRKTIGENLKRLQFLWPIGMPLVRKLDSGLWELRLRLRNGSARILFSLNGNDLVLLHAFLKKTRKIPNKEFRTAKRRMSKVGS